MYFDPFSAWLVVLVADGIAVAEEKSGNRGATYYDQKYVARHNDMLNANIRRIKERYGLNLASMAYDEITLNIKATRSSPSFQHARGQIILDLDNQDYIITVLEECAKEYGKYENVEEYRRKAAWFKKAAIKAKSIRAQSAISFEQNRIREAKEAAHDQMMTKIYLIAGWVIIIGFIMFLFAG